jgi:hypothetical protein
MGQLPKVRLTPRHIFSKGGVDYTGPLLIKVGHTRKPSHEGIGMRFSLHESQGCKPMGLTHSLLDLF